MTTGIGMTGDQYLTGLTLYFVGYVRFEVPANTVLKLGTPRIWLPTLSLIWGVVATLLGMYKTTQVIYLRDSSWVWLRNALERPRE